MLFEEIPWLVFCTQADSVRCIIRWSILYKSNNALKWSDYIEQAQEIRLFTETFPIDCWKGFYSWQCLNVRKTTTNSNIKQFSRAVVWISKWHNSSRGVYTHTWEQLRLNSQLLTSPCTDGKVYTEKKTKKQLVHFPPRAKKLETFGLPSIDLCRSLILILDYTVSL